jgi:hypothetical protein
MSYPYPGDITSIAEALQTKIAGGTFTVTPSDSNPMDVWYGDQNTIGRTPTVCIEPDEKQRTLEGLPNMTVNEFTIFILVYHNKVQDMQLTRKECDVLAYEIEKLIHQDLQLTNGGSPRLIHGFVRQNESGYTYKGNTLYRTARLTFYGKNKTSLPVA